MYKNRSNFSLNISKVNQKEFELVIDRISYYEDFVTIPFGIIGNLISIFIFTRPSLNKKTNTGLLFTILCLINIYVVLNEALFYWPIINTFVIKLHLNNNVVVKFLERVVEQSLSWIQALISFDRFITVFFPVKGVRLMSKKWVSMSILFGIFVLISSANSFHFVLYVSISTRNNNNFNQLFIINNLIDILMKICIPYLIIVVFDLMVIVRLRRSKPELRSRQPRRNKSYRFTINTILIDLLFLIFNIPSILIFYFKRILNLNSPPLPIQVLPLLANIYSHLFFILFFIFNRIFRHEFVSIFKRNSCFNYIYNSSS